MDRAVPSADIARRRPRRRSTAAAAAVAAGLLVASLPTLASAATTGEGTLDISFSTDGKTTFKTGTVADDVAEAVVPLSDGRTYVVGWQDGGTTTDAVVVRLLANGSVDTSYGSAGRFVLSDADYEYEFRTAAAGPGGTLVLGGFRYSAATGRDPVLVRLTATGAIDTSFDFDGKVIPSTPGFDVVTALAVDADGSVVFVSDANGAASVLRRVLPSGSYDQGFKGSTGLSILPAGSDTNDVLRLVDGRYVVAGWRTSPSGAAQGVLLAVKPDATPDTTFGTNGIATTTHPTTQSTPFDAVSVDLQGRLVAVGEHFDPAADAPQWRLLTARFTLGGQPDASLGGAGWAVEASGVLPAGNNLVDAAIDRRGRGVVLTFDSESRQRVVRLTQSGSLDPTFSTDGVTGLSFGTGSTELYGVGIGRNGRIAVVGSYDGGSATTMAVARYLGDRTPPSAGSMLGLRSWAPSATTSVPWSATDDNTGIASYGVRYRSASATSSTFGSYTTWKTATTARSAPFAGASGRTYCFSSRAKDRAGNLGAYGRASCVVFPVDDRGLVRSGVWTAQTGSSYYRSTVLRSTTAGASLSFPGADYRELGLVATTCATCGTVKVFRGSTLLTTVSLQSATTRHRVVLNIESSSTIRSGTITIRQASGGKPVLIDGLVVGLVQQF